jgi:DNA-binding LacI/PurR family transcriptional regulator
MNGKPGVSARTRSIVLRTAEYLGADPVRRPQRLDAGLVGLLVPELDNPIFPALAQLIEHRLAAEGYACVFGCATHVVDEIEYLTTLSQRGVSGIIMVSGRHADTLGDHSQYLELIASGIPMVFLNGFALDVPAAFVSTDDRRAADIAVRHLAELGHGRIGFVSGPSRYVVVERRREGYRQAVAAVGGDLDPELEIQTLFSVEGGRAAIGHLLERGATAAITGSDLLALGTVLGARERGLDVPRDWSVVGYDDSPLMAFTDPPLTTVRQPVRTICDHAARILIDRLASPSTVLPAAEFLCQPDLVVRASTAPAALRRL